MAETRLQFVEIPVPIQRVPLEWSRWAQFTDGYVLDLTLCGHDVDAVAAAVAAEVRGGRVIQATCRRIDARYLDVDVFVT